MKASAQRRRSKAEVLEDKAGTMRKERELQEKLQQIQQMEQQMQAMRDENQKLQSGVQQVEAMFDEGLIKHADDGSFVAVENPAEREHIKKQITMSKRKQTMSAAEAQQIQQNLPDVHEDAEEYGLE